MKVFIYTQSFVPRVGGVETYVRLLAQGLLRRLTQGDERENAAQSRPDAQNTVTLVTATPGDHIADRELRFSVIRRPKMRVLWGLIGDADVLHLAGPVFVPLSMGILRRKPIVVEHHGYQAICPNGLLLDERTKRICPGHFMHQRYSECVRCCAVERGWLRSVWALVLTIPRRAMCCWASANIAVSRHVLDRLELPRSKVIYHGLPDPLKGSATDDLTAPAVEGRSKLTMAYVGRLVAEKGLHLLLEAAGRLSGEGYAFCLKFVGDGPERESLESLACRSSIRDRIIFTGVLRGTALELATADVDVVVMPSIWAETAGLAAMEHMMRGRTVVVSDIGGLSEVVGEAGLKFSAGDVDGLVGALRTILEDRTILARLGERARHRAVRMFSEESMVDQHVALYRDLLSWRS